MTAALTFCTLARSRTTADHTLVAERVRRGIISPQQAETSTIQNVLIRALGVHAETEPDIREFELNPDERLLLCTDGLTRLVNDSEIAKIILAAPKAQSAADQLVALANERGGQDNVTVIVVRFSEKLTLYPSTRREFFPTRKLWGILRSLRASQLLQGSISYA